MKVYSGKEIRNVAVLGHSGTGKTSLIEAILDVVGLTKRLGKVSDGNTVSDYDQEEIKRKSSVFASIIPVEWKDTKINFIDVPGYFDFIGEAKQALRVADLALIVVSAKSGIQVGTEKAWEYATEIGCPKMIFVNEMDDENADMDAVVESLKEKFGKSIAPVQVPFKEDGHFVGFINAIKKEGRKYINGRTEDCSVPDDLVEAVDIMHSMVEEAVAETEDSLMEKFFAEEPFTVEEIQRGIGEGILEGIVTPVLCGSALLNIGTRVLINSIISYLPGASELLPKITAKDARTDQEIEIKCDETRPFSALVFKTIADPYVGRLSIFRVYSGTLKKDDVIANPAKDHQEKVSRLYVLRGKDQIEVDELKAGDIGALAKLSATETGDTLCAKSTPVIISGIKYPQPLYSMAVVPKGKGDEDKISQAFSKILEEDKTISFEINRETKESIVSGMGDSHLDVVVNKLKNKYKIDVDLVVPIVPYREMLKSKVKVQGKHKKQSGGHGQYGDVWIEFEPSNDTSKQYIFEEKVVGGAVPKGYFPAVEKGIQDCVKAGPIAGYPVVGIKATLVDGSYHDVDSSEMAFKMATTNAFKEAFVKAKSAILEPVGKAEILVPNKYTGDIMGDMNKRRGRILGMEEVGEKQAISVEVPISEMFEYPIDLRSMTHGRGEFTLKFERYDEAPMEVQQKVIEQRKKEHEEQQKH